MMSGPEHYREAERLVDNAVHHTTEHPGDMRIAEVCAATAQAHATLALTAVKALELLRSPYKPDGNVSDWAAPIGYVVDAEIVEDDS